MQTHLSPATPLILTGQFTYQAEQKMQCLSMTLFLALLDENQPRAICEMYQRCGSGMLSPQMEKEVERCGCCR